MATAPLIHSQYAAIRLCRWLEPIVSRYGFHVGLTGGCLYADGNRKDIDIIIYEHKLGETVFQDFLDVLHANHFVVDGVFSRIVKATSPTGIKVDFFLFHRECGIGGNPGPSNDAE